MEHHFDEGLGYVYGQESDITTAATPQGNGILFNKYLKKVDADNGETHHELEDDADEGPIRKRIHEQCHTQQGGEQTGHYSCSPCETEQWRQRCSRKRSKSHNVCTLH